jgi:hypothetical protein
VRRAAFREERSEFPATKHVAELNEVHEPCAGTEFVVFLDGVIEYRRGVGCTERGCGELSLKIVLGTRGAARTCEGERGSGDPELKRIAESDTGEAWASRGGSGQGTLRQKWGGSGPVSAEDSTEEQSARESLHGQGVSDGTCRTTDQERVLASTQVPISHRK